MKKLVFLFLALLVLSVPLTASCRPSEVQTGLLQGGVTIGPISPVEVPGVQPTVSPGVFSSRKVLVYDASGKKLLKEVTINQVGQTANGYYAALLDAGDYVIDVTHTGIGGAAGLPKSVTIKAGQTVTLDIDIDTGIR